MYLTHLEHHFVQSSELVVRTSKLICIPKWCWSGYQTNQVGCRSDTLAKNWKRVRWRGIISAYHLHRCLSFFFFFFDMEEKHLKMQGLRAAKKLSVIHDFPLVTGLNWSTNYEQQSRKLRRILRRQSMRHCSRKTQRPGILWQLVSFHLSELCPFVR